MAEKEKTNLYLLSIVAIVAVVGIVILVLNGNGMSSNMISTDSAGQGIAALKVFSPGIKLCKVYCGYSSTCNAGSSETCGTLVWKKFTSSADACRDALYIAGGGPSITTEPDGEEGAMWNLCGGYGTPYDETYVYWGSTREDTYS